jgi:hypothetical protein
LRSARFSHYVVFSDLTSIAVSVVDVVPANFSKYSLA